MKGFIFDLHCVFILLKFVWIDFQLINCRFKITIRNYVNLKQANQ
jgi:hypothetical protein